MVGEVVESSFHEEELIQVMEEEEGLGVVEFHLRQKRAEEHVGAEVEEAVKRHEAVADCLVVGLPDERLGNRVVAVYALTAAGTALEEDTLRAFVRAQLAGYKVPRIVEFWQEIPKLPNGKINKRAVLAVEPDGSRDER